MKILMMACLVLCLISAAYAAQGNAVYYDPPYTSKCLYLIDLCSFHLFLI